MKKRKKSEQESLLLIDEQPEVVQEEVNEKSAEIQSAAIGAILTKARQAKHLKLASVAKKLCIKESYLEALEQGQYYVFPALVYGVGFLRSYATFLELNADELVMRFQAETIGIKEEPVSAPRPTDPNLMPSLSVILKSLLGLFLLYLVWNMYKAFSTPNVQPLKPVEQIVIETSDEAISEADKLLQEAQAKMEAEKARKPVVYGLKKPDRVSFVATDRSKIEIRDTDEDSVLLSKVLEAGDTYNPDEDSEGLVLKTTNAGALDVYIDGKLVRTLGRKDQPIAGVQLDAKSLLKE